MKQAACLLGISTITWADWGALSHRIIVSRHPDDGELPHDTQLKWAFDLQLSSRWRESGFSRRQITLSMK